MSFKNIRLPKCVELGATGGPGFKTTIIETVSGEEYRNMEWSRQRGRWDVGYTQDKESIDKIIAFFQVMRGRAYGFRFRDWSDYQVDSIVAIANGEKRTFQAAKVYDLGDDLQFFRPLTRLDDASVAVIEPQGDETRLSYSLDEDTGLITFASPPPEGYAVRLVGTFDVPVRFDIDELPVTMLTQKVARIDSVPLIEIRDQ